MDKLSEEYCCGPEPLCDEGIKTKCRLAQLEGAWENAGHRCLQCGTGNPKVAQLEAEKKGIKELRDELASLYDEDESHDMGGPHIQLTWVIERIDKALEAGGEPWDKEVVGDEEWY